MTCQLRGRAIHEALDRVSIPSLRESILDGMATDVTERFQSAASKISWQNQISQASRPLH